MNKNLIVIEGLAIRQDSEGRYCLNDLHKAAGEGSKDKPANFLRREETIELVKVLESEKHNPVNVVIGKGKEQGTFVCKELVYAYAMWISPQFNLKVIRAFDTLQTQGVAVADHAAEDLLNDPLSFMEKLFAQAKVLKAERDALQAEMKLAAPKVAVYDEHVADPQRHETIAKFSRTLEGVNTLQVKNDLALAGVLYRKDGSYRVYAKYRDSHFVEKLNAYATKPTYDIFVTSEGKILLTKLYQEGRLTLKKDYQ
jgi:phage antirepressor YoqD-like protein